VMDRDKEQRVYRLMQTVVRRIREPGDTSGKRVAAKRSKAPSR
jgi:hypothetical protein